MKDDFISAGVAPGGLYNREEIRTLLCDLTMQLARPLTISVAEAALTGEGLVNYFEFHAALQELTQTGKLELESSRGELVLRLPRRYHQAAATLARDLPRHARDRALHAAEQLQQSSRREADNRISVYPTKDGGFYITFRQGESDDMLMSVTIYVPDKEQAELVRRRFLEEPGRLYRAVIGAL
jgi:hypothetical protein